MLKKLATLTFIALIVPLEAIAQTQQPSAPPQGYDWPGPWHMWSDGFGWPFWWSGWNLGDIRMARKEFRRRLRLLDKFFDAQMW